MKTKKQQGFTIIEVVLVLAIAGLIFLVVFLAVPALQRGQRDTARRNDVGRVIAAVQSYRTNSKGTLPATADWNGAAFKGAYLTPAGEKFEDPQTGNVYTLDPNPANNASVPPASTMMVHVGRVCADNTDATATNAGGRNVAIRISLEGGGVYCASN